MTLPPITDKQITILTLLYRFRFLNRIQIQTILHHKYPKRINDWLRDLTEKEYIGKIYSNKLGLNTKPAVYYISLNAIRYLKTQDYPTEQLRKLYREKERSQNCIDKYLLLADICLELQNKSDNKTRFAAATKSDFSNPESNYIFLVELGPDLIFAKEIDSMMKYYLLEILEPTLPVYSLRKRIKEYFDFYFSNSWEENVESDFPTLLFICPTTAMLIYTKRFTKKLVSEYDDIEILIQFATEKSVKESGVEDDIWETK